MMRKPKVLIIESDNEHRAFLRQALEGVHYATATFATGSAALEKLRDTPFDVVVTALELDDRFSGLRVARAVKWRWPETSVIILTGSDTFDAVRAARNLGVNAYLPKPVGEVRLQKAIQQALERRQGPADAGEGPSVLRWRGLVLCRQKDDVTLDGEPIHLTLTEFKLLRYLMENGHQVVSPEELYEVLHGQPPLDPARANDTIRWHVHNLRHKIEPDPRRPIYILNVYGLGYTFAAVEEMDPRRRGRN